MLLHFNQVYKKYNNNFNVIMFNLFQFTFNKIEKGGRFYMVPNKLNLNLSASKYMKDAGIYFAIL